MPLARNVRQARCAAARPRRAPHRRRHPRRRAAPEAAARRAAREPAAPRCRCADRDRALARPARRDRAAPARHAAASARRAARAAACPPDAPRVETALLLGAAQILFLDVPDHAAVDLSVRLAQADRRAAHYAGLVNAVLRRWRAKARRRLAAARQRAARHAGLADGSAGSRTTAPSTARAIAAANAQEPALDLTVKSDPQAWADAARRPRAADRHGAHHRAWAGLAAAGLRRGRMVGAGRRRGAAGAAARRRARQDRRRSLRRARRQDRAACRRPARRSPRSIARSRGSTRLRENLDAARTRRPRPSPPTPPQWQAGPFDAVLLDAPCSSTGTIRRHPDIPWLKREADLATLAALQPRLLDRAADLVKPGGTLVYCTCSLEPEEGEHADRRAARPQSRAAPPPDRAPTRSAGSPNCSPPAGDLRTLPCHLPDPDPRMAGLDGFYAARLATDLRDLQRLLPRLAAVHPSLYVAPGRGGTSGRPRRRRGERFDGRPVDRGAGQAVRAPGAPRRCACSPAACAAIRCIALALRPGKTDRLVIAPQDLRTADAHPRERDLRRPLRLRRQGRDLRRPLAVRDRRRRPTNGRRRCSASAGCAICAPPNPASPAPMPARWSTNGSRCRARWHPIAWRPEILARRIISWLSQAPLILHDADVQFYRRFLRSLTRQVRYLRHTAVEAARRRAAPAGADRADLRGAVHGRARRATCARRASSGWSTSWSARSCPTAATSAAIPAR